MRIRTITTGVDLERSTDRATLHRTGEFNREARSAFEDQGYVVQTTRVATNPWRDYFAAKSPGEVVEEARRMEALCQENGVDFLSLGYCGTPDATAVVPEIIRATSIVSCCTRLGSRPDGINYENTAAAAEAIKRISEHTAGGYGNFRFCGWANCQPGTPFFPTAYHRGPESFSIGLECSSLVVRAFSQADSPEQGGRRLRSILNDELRQIEDIAMTISDRLEVAYAGLDTSIAPSLREDESIALACERVGPAKFGYQGTLPAVASITNALRDLPVKACGYRGLMLPVCEDWGLAHRAAEGTYDLTSLLLYATVCGCGLDAVPLPGDTPVQVIRAILLDVATLAIRLDKPLSARLLLVPGKAAGEKTDFGSPYLVDSTILHAR